MSKIKNILFIMADQLRWDYLSCYGHPYLKTPNIDMLASKGVLFESSFVQSPICGPSRASFYTGRTVFSHGATLNQVPLPIGELTIGDYLRKDNIKTAVVGKTHMKPDKDGMERLGLTKETDIGVIISEPGFDPYERDDGLHPNNWVKNYPTALSYNKWLNSLGYEGDNPWETWANSSEGPNGELLSGWKLRNSNKKARIKEEHSETAYMTNRAIDFMKENTNEQWMLHLSYIKPHWPYIAPAPYHNMYSPNQFYEVKRKEKEKNIEHEVYKAFTNAEVSKVFSRREVRESVITGYMGLIKQIDDNLGRLFEFMKTNKLFDNTMIVFTSDHGDYLGDHWLGEKELFHEQSVRVPLIIYDPSKTANLTRGRREKKLVESIDLLPTFLEALSCSTSTHRLEGNSLMPILQDRPVRKWRESVFSEIDYSLHSARKELNLGPLDARAFMIRTEKWKYIYYKSFPPQLFDLENDPEEYSDLGQEKKYENIRNDLKDLLLKRLINRKNLLSVEEKFVLRGQDVKSEGGVIIGVW